MSFYAHSSSITYLVGENGVGKTTWIKLATGRLVPNGGSILFDGKPFRYIRNQISVVLDEPPIYGNLNGYENLIALSGIRKLDEEMKVELEEKFQLDRFLMKKKAHYFSLGQRHRLAVAIALVRNPRFLILDEPTIGLDPISWNLIKTQLQHLAKSGVTIILTGHDFEQISKIADKIVILNKGKTIYEDSVLNFNSTTNKYLELLVDKIDTVTDMFPLTQKKIIDHKVFLRIPLVDENSTSLILKNIHDRKVNIYDLKVISPSLKEIYMQILQESKND
ncbi:ATP-binding cassette domain-containing protein [Gottfriedia sp. NPDC056225]|uniref:ATP-binding cassette domain-containing protein n=1 Tax=Gottfriedia sp. NPDC056225 TaxID=3345751 RepID=UPI0035E35EFB